MTPRPTVSGGGQAIIAAPGAAFVLLLIIPAFAIGASSLVEAWSRPEYSHGPLIPLISGYLFLRQLRDDPRRGSPPGAQWPGFATAAAALVIGGLAAAARIPDIATYGMILWLYGLALIGFGWERGKDYWPPVLHLAFMLPLPNMIYWKVSLALQSFASKIGVALIRALDIPVFLEGNIIDLGDLRLHVAEACSGLRYLFPILSFSYVFAILFRGPFWVRAAIFLSAAPIAILMNSLRIGAIGVLADRFGTRPAENFLHYFEGWLVFVICIAMILTLASLLKFLIGDRRRFLEALDLDHSGIGPVLFALIRARWTRPLIVLATMTAIASVAYNLSLNRAEVIPHRRGFDQFPMQVEDWRGSRLSLDRDVERVLGADDSLLAIFAAGEGQPPIELFVAYYDRMTAGEGVHSPEVCLPGGGWEIDAITETTFRLDLETGPQDITVNRAVIVKGDRRQLVYYWFDQRGRRLTSDYEAKAWAVWDSIARRRTDGALVRTITSIGRGEKASDAEARMRAFLEDALNELTPHLPD